MDIMKDHIVTRKILIPLLILIPPISIFYFVNTYGVTLPYMDQWALVSLLEKAHNSDLSLSDFWQQHNEHRIIFPKLIMMGLATLTKWNIMYELYTSILLACLLFLFIYSLKCKTFLDKRNPWTPVIFSFLIFSTVQWENWTWGWQFQIFLSVLSTVIAVWSVTMWPGKLKGIFLAVAAAVISSFSFTNGLLTWIIVGLLLLLRRDRNFSHIVMWTGFFVATVILYYYDYTKPGLHPSLFVFITHPYDYIRYILAYIGAPFVFAGKDQSIFIGLILLIALCSSTVSVYRSGRDNFERILPWLILALYVFFSAASTGLGRLGFGINQALASRYTTISTILIISTIIIIFSQINIHLKSNKKLPVASLIFLCLFSVLLTGSYILASDKGINELKARKTHTEMARICLENADEASNECLEVLYPNAASVRAKSKTLRQLSLLKMLHYQQE